MSATSQSDISTNFQFREWSLKHTATLFALSDHYILSREWRVIVNQVQTNYRGIGLWYYNQSGVTELLIMRGHYYGRMCFKSVKACRASLALSYKKWSADIKGSLLTSFTYTTNQFPLCTHRRNHAIFLSYSVECMCPFPLYCPAKANSSNCLLFK